MWYTNHCQNGANFRMNSRLKGKLIHLPIFYKILVANTGIIAVGAVVGTWLTRELSQSSAPEQLIIIFIMMGIILSILMNRVSG